MLWLLIQNGSSLNTVFAYARPNKYNLDSCLSMMNNLERTEKIRKRGTTAIRTRDHAICNRMLWPLSYCTTGRSDICKLHNGKLTKTYTQENFAKMRTAHVLPNTEKKMH